MFVLFVCLIVLLVAWFVVFVCLFCFVLNVSLCVLFDFGLLCVFVRVWCLLDCLF